MSSLTKISRSKLAEIIAGRCGDGADKHRLSLEIAAFILENNQVSELDSIMRDVINYRANHGVVEVDVSSAYSLSDQSSAEIKSIVHRLYPGAESIIISDNVATPVIGGVQLTIADKQLDLSIRGKLNKFKQLTITSGGV